MYMFGGTLACLSIYGMHDFQIVGLGSFGAEVEGSDLSTKVWEAQFSSTLVRIRRQAVEKG